MKESILKVIAQNYPFTYEDIMEIYEKVNSYDKLIIILDFSLSNRVLPLNILVQYNNSHNDGRCETCNGRGMIKPYANSSSRIICSQCNGSGLKVTYNP